MPITLYDEDGNAKEVPTEEEIKQQIGEKEQQLAEVTEKLQKLENKDFNFKKLKDMTEAEKERLSEVELGLKKQQEALEENQKNFFEKQIEGHKNDALNVLVGADDELREKVLLNYERIKDDATTQAEINKKMREAHLLTLGQLPDASPSQLSQAMGATGLPAAKPKSGELTQEQKALGAKLGLTEEDYKL